MNAPPRNVMGAPREHLATILGVKPEELPRVFQGRRPCVLKIGISADLMERYPNAPRPRIRHWLARFCRSRPYLMRVIRGTHRHDLDGNHVALITGDAREAAKATLDAMNPRPRAQQEAA